MKEEYKNINSNYNKNLKNLSRNLRVNSTFGEVILWDKVLKSKMMLGYNFNRQFPMKINDKSIIVDFICRKLNLIIELDGYSHNFKYDEDLNRDKILLEKGYIVLRIQENDVRNDLSNVIRVIEGKIKELE
jgi:very-short-patch-repair endonuclease